MFCRFLSKKILGRLQKRLFCENKQSPMIAYNLKHKRKKKQNKNGDFRSMPFKELAFFADVKLLEWSKHTGIQLQCQNSKVMVIFTHV